MAAFKASPPSPQAAEVQASNWKLAVRVLLMSAVSPGGGLVVEGLAVAGMPGARPPRQTVPRLQHPGQTVPWLQAPGPAAPPAQSHSHPGQPLSPWAGGSARAEPISPRPQPSLHSAMRPSEVWANGVHEPSHGGKKQHGQDHWTEQSRQTIMVALLQCRQENQRWPS